MELQRKAARRHAPEKDHAVVPLLQIAWMLRRAVARKIFGRRHGDEFQIAHAPCHQRLVGEFAAADHAVHVVADDVHRAVAHAQVEVDVRVARLELREMRNDEQARNRRAHINAQSPARRGARLGHAGFQLVEIGEQAHGAVVIGGAVGGHGHAACGAVEQLDLEPVFQRLHVLGDGGFWQLQRVGSECERARLHHAREDAHCVYLVHGADSHTRCMP
ncbi:hypothetical protein SDC9_106687 [bioreactor metagenome]|uniref:Uncharacterized protein n=1 Tax=bioreactor metagenome TaxID=1076179 RepID=A0A645B5F3_9ZZZZ